MLILCPVPNLPDIPPGEAPDPATNLTLTQEAGGWVLRWIGPKDQDPKDPNRLIYYTIQIREDQEGKEWTPFTDKKIDVDEASYMSNF